MNKFIGPLVFLSLLFLESASGQVIDPDSLHRDIEVLSSDAYQGRDTGTEGERAAARYLAARFEALGLATRTGDEDYFAEYTLYRSALNQETSHLRISRSGTEQSYALGRDFRPYTFFGATSGRYEGDLLFAGWGIDAPEQGYTFWEENDVEGRLLLVFRDGLPEEAKEVLKESRGYSYRRRLAKAKEAGAAGILFVRLEREAVDMRLFEPLDLKPNEDESEAETTDKKSFLLAELHPEVVESWLGQELSDVVFDLEREASPKASILPDLRVNLAVNERDESLPVPTQNVVAVLPGSDPELASEIVVIGAHYDHVGSFAGSAGDRVYNGADDNASGTSGLLALAEAFARQETAPARTLVFAAFSGEEKGLLGSRTFVESEQIEISKIRFMLNLDMIGRLGDRQLEVVGDGYVEGLKKVVEKANESAGVNMVFGGESYAANSDHHPFYKASIPFSFFFSGLHDDYHGLGDHVEKIDFDSMDGILELAFVMISDLANRPESLPFVHRFDPLGLTIVDRGGATVTTVADASRAHRARLKVGDRILRVGGEAVETARQAARVLDEAGTGEKVELLVERAQRQRRIRLFKVAPGYLGVDVGNATDEEVERYQLTPTRGVKLDSVIGEGPAATAGLQGGDIVLSLDGGDVGPSNLTMVLCRLGAGAKTRAKVIREGRRLSMKVVLGERPSRRRRR